MLAANETDARPVIPIAPNLFELSAEGARLIGSRCVKCGEVTFPVSAFCPQCCTETTETIPLSRRGTLYSFTVQRFRPPPPYRGPGEFEPYGVGMIELPEGLRVTAVLADEDPDSLCVGMEMELIVMKLFEDEMGRDVLGYKFRRVHE
ncbi:MAG TPA: Zn-ribbon domain-containing OB-fold protein [Pyrinomonadaceae bacterium]|nr:Zn-ribbon domain-containing OB-fold protein [Pyrinomonadaceae bacterium]